MRSTISLIVPLLLLTGAGFGLAGESDSTAPVLSIVSRLGVDRDVKIFNDEPILFFAKAGDQDNAPLLRGIRFVLYDEGGNPDRRECIRSESTDPPRWGKPPSSFEYPLVGKELPPGRYRLRATRPGWQPVEIKLVKAEFCYQSLRADHEREFYRANFALRLVDRTEKRRAVRVKVLVETANGGLLDSVEVKLVRNTSRSWLWETIAPVRISSLVKVPDQSRPAGKRTGVLKLVPNCRLIFVLDGVRFPWPVPLPSEERCGSGQARDAWK